MCTASRCTPHHKHFRLIKNPFPADVHPGACLHVVAQYHALQRTGKPCELVDESDDPHEPVRCVDVIALTIWDRRGQHECACHEEKREPCCECHTRRGRGCNQEDDQEKEDREVQDLRACALPGTAPRHMVGRRRISAPRLR
jgi:hypothetical protein